MVGLGVPAFTQPTQPSHKSMPIADGKVRGGRLCLSAGGVILCKATWLAASPLSTAAAIFRGEILGPPIAICWRVGAVGTKWGKACR